MCKKKPTMKTIAQEAGTTAATVSMALRNHPRIGSATKARIHKIAKRLGYTPDAKLVEFMSYLRSSEAKEKHSAIAFLSAYPQRDAIHRNLPLRAFFEGA